MYGEVAGITDLVETAKHVIEIDSARFPQAEIVRRPCRLNWIDSVGGPTSNGQ